MDKTMQTILEHIRNQLNQEQFAAATYSDTPSLILAGAGSGKTRTLIYKIAYLVGAKNIPMDNILAVTFTNKAADEMKQRLMAIMSEIRQIQNQPINTYNYGYFDTHTQNCKRIGTFHSIFLKILKQEIITLKMGYTSEFVVIDTHENKTILKEILKNNGYDEYYKESEVQSHISKRKNQGITHSMLSKQTLPEYQKTMAHLYQLYQETLQKNNIVDFDDLLLLPYLLFRYKPDVLQKRQSHFHHILVDEAQDTNRIQFELLKMLAKKDTIITLIGDDFQSIYGWRGAVMENFLEVHKYRPTIKIFVLHTNYRSRPHIVQAGNHIIKQNTRQYHKELVAYKSGYDNIILFAHNDETQEAINIIQLIQKIKEQKNTLRSDHAILYRTNAQSSPFEQILLQEGIPYKIRGAFKFFERKEIKDILAYLKYILNPKDTFSLQRIINVPNRKIGKTTRETIQKYADSKGTTMHEVLEKIQTYDIDLSTSAKKAVGEFVQLIHTLHKNLDVMNPAEFLQSLITTIQYKEFLLKEEGGNSIIVEEKYENIGQLINMASKYDTTGQKALRQFMEEVSLLSDAAEDKEDQKDAIKLMTIHASKGLEFRFVYIVGLEENIFPLASALTDQKLLEEERRLMYVALTRAMDHVFLSYAQSRMQRGYIKTNPPSSFIEELPQELIKKYHLGENKSKKTSGKISGISEGSMVRHKIFGLGQVLEVRNNQAIVQFHNPKFGIRKMQTELLELV